MELTSPQPQYTSLPDGPAPQYLPPQVRQIKHPHGLTFNFGSDRHCEHPKTVEALPSGSVVILFKLGAEDILSLVDGTYPVLSPAALDFKEE